MLSVCTKTLRQLRRSQTGFLLWGLIHISQIAFSCVGKAVELSEVSHVQSNREENGKNSVLLLNTFTYQSEFLGSFRAKTQRINKLYADKWGYSYQARYISFHNSTIPPPWQRIKDSLDILEEDHFDYIFYLDLDAAVANHSTSVEYIVNFPGKNADLVVGRERRGTDKEKRRMRTYYHYANPGYCRDCHYR